jgi:hypothetical protein
MLISGFQSLIPEKLQYSYSYSYITSILRSGLNLEEHFPSNASVNCAVYSDLLTIAVSRFFGPLPEKLR